jgi:hypothetical protein
MVAMEITIGFHAKRQYPNHKQQTNPDIQIQNSKPPPNASFENWNVGSVWNLVLEIWNFLVLETGFMPHKKQPEYSHEDEHHPLSAA